MNLLNYFQSIEPKENIWFTSKTVNTAYEESMHDIFADVERDSYWFYQRNRCLLALAQQYTKQKTLIDIGGGNGFVSLHFQENGWTAVNIEPGLGGCRNAEARGLEFNICGTIEDAKPFTNSLPNCGAFDVIEHIEKDFDFVKTVHNSLQDNGIFLVTVPAFNSLWSNDDIQVGHFTRYTKKSITHLLERAGFKVEFSSYLFSFLVLPIFLVRSIPYRFGFGKGGTTAGGHKNNHSVPKGIVGKLLQFLLNFEYNRISKGKKILVGSTVIVVARKV